MAQVLGRIGPLFPLPPVPASGPHAGSNGGMGHERTWVPYSESTMASASLRERMARVSASWCRFGAGAPAVVSLFYVSKAALYWLAFCWLAGLDPAGSPQRLSGDVGLDLHKRFIVFNMLFEALGLGCGAGPLNAKYAPPLLSFVWHNLFSPLRLPPLVGPWATARCARRTALDASLYVAFLALSLRIIVVSGLSESESQPQGAQLQPGPPEKVPWSEVAALMACFTALGARDRVFALAGRVEVYGYLLAACLLARSDAEAVAGMQVVQVAIWVFAGTSKLGPWFAFVLPIMLSNCPLLSPLGKLRSWALWRHVPDDLRPSRLMHAMAHFGTAAEFAFPLALCAGGHLGLLGVVGCMGFHAFIIAQVPMGAPVEWNLFSMHNALFLFTSTQGAFDVRALCGTLFGDGDSRDTAAQGLGARLAALASSVHAPGLQLAALQAPPLQLFLLLACVALPIYGQLRPDKVSFLLAFRYYGTFPIWCHGGTVPAQYIPQYRDCSTWHSFAAARKLARTSFLKA